MKKNTVFFILLLSNILVNNVFSQNNISGIASKLPKNLKWNLIEKEFYIQLNNLRKEKRVSELKYGDAILNLAATDQSAYMCSTKVVGHNQKIKGKETPSNRVIFYNGTHDGVGENCLQIFINKPYKTKYKKEPIVLTTEKEIATALFLSWKNSPPHFENMIAPDYDIAGLGFYYGKDSSLYSAQVFSALPYKPLKAFESPADAFGIKDENKSICQCMTNKSWADISSDLMIVFGEDSIYLKSEKYGLLKPFFNETGDAIYLDYVFRDQFTCLNNNLLHGSPVYDGFMTKPVLFKDLFKRNIAIGTNNFYATLCAIPQSLKEKLKHTSINYGIVKKGYMCKYIYSVPVPQDNIDALTLVPKWIDNQALEITPDTFNGTVKFNIPFERGKTDINELYKNEIDKRLDIYKPFIKHIEIKTYSSIEGNSDVNLKLQTLRAENVKKYISTQLAITANTTIEAKENWDVFYNEIKNTKFQNLLLLSKPEIKKALQDKKLLESIDPILKKSRIATIEITIEANVNNNSHPLILIGAYQKALLQGDSLKSFACQSKLISYLRKYQLTNNDISQIVIPSNRKFITHLTNWVGLATNDDELFYTRETRDKAIFYQSMDTNYLPLQFNYCIMALKYMQQLGDTIIPISQLEYKMKKCYQMKTKTDSMYVDYMLLNYNLLTAYFSYETHQFDKVDKPLNEIKKYFTKHTISETEAVKLGLLFNLYGRCSWTLNLIKPMINKNSTNEELLFLYVQTYFAISSQFEESESKVLLEKAKKMNKERFKNWIDKDCFQLLRQDIIKEVYCN